MGRTRLVACLAAGTLFALAAWLLRPEPSRRPNVLLVMWDTVRADRLSLYGHERNTTPWLERFAADAIVFDRATSPATWTVPAHASLFTGLPVSSHGADNGWTWLDHRFTTLAELLGDEGYDTYAWSANPYLSPATNLLQGFDDIEMAWQGDWAEQAREATMGKRIQRDRSVELSPSWKPDGHGRGWPVHLATHKDAGPVARSAFLAWLDGREPERPFFAYLNYLEAHHPRLPSLEGRRQVLEPAMIEQGLELEASMFSLMSAMEGRHAFSEDDLEALRGVYDASLADLDRATGALMEDLEARGVLDDTVVVLLADHGEHLGEHGMYDHRWSVYQPLLHVPLVIRHPDVAPGRVAEPVSTLDLFATVCDLVGIEPPTPSLGRSLVSGGAGTAVAERGRPESRLGSVRRAHPDLDPNRWDRSYEVILDGDDKLVRDVGGTPRLFDLGSDPGEQRDRSGDDPGRVDELTTGLSAWLDRFPPYDPALRRPDDTPGRPLQPNDRTQEQLRVLGYAD